MNIGNRMVLGDSVVVVEFMKGKTSKVNGMDLGDRYGQMVNIMLASGKMAITMDKERGLKQMEQKKKVDGKMVCFLEHHDLKIYLLFKY